jgi:hypothetical protein
MRTIVNMVIISTGCAKKEGVTQPNARLKISRSAIRSRRGSGPMKGCLEQFNSRESRPDLTGTLSPAVAKNHNR